MPTNAALRDRDPDHDSKGGPSTIDRLEHELAHVARALEAAQRRRHYPLERAQYLLLKLLEAEGPQPITDLAARLLLDDSTVTRQVAAMEAQALIDRKPNPKDGRSTLIHATRRGLAIAARMRAMRIDRIARLFDGWEQAECEEFAALLTRFNASLRHAFSVRD